MNNNTILVDAAALADHRSQNAGETYATSQNQNRNRERRQEMVQANGAVHLAV